MSLGSLIDGYFYKYCEKHVYPLSNDQYKIYKLENDDIFAITRYDTTIAARSVYEFNIECTEQDNGLTHQYVIDWFNKIVERDRKLLADLK